MNSISVATAACLQSFPQLAAALQDPEHCRMMPREKLQRELNRFKIWCGNLGALQTGRSSLDFRLRDSTVVRTNVLKLLGRLHRVLTMGIEVATKARLPFEKLPKPEDSEPSDEESEEEDSEEEPPTELGLYMTTIMEILGDLYRVSFRIRNSTTRPRPLKPSLYKEVDEETKVDKFTTYAAFDKRHVEESIVQLRKEAAERMYIDPSKAAKIPEDGVFLIDRLAATLTERRKILRYWHRHAKKLATGPEEVKGSGPVQSSSVVVPNDTGQTLDVRGLVEGSQRVQTELAPSVTAKTILSGTVATEYDRKLDDMLDAQSVTSYASTSFDVDGNVVDLPFPPATASKQTEFLCPYCGIVYPSRYAKHRAWRAHVLQDLQPYICTYPDCPEGLQMYSTRHAWLEHERLVHRRVWHCFEHKTAVFGSQSDLRLHLESQHNDDVTEAQVQSLLDVSESSLGDAREKCPICLIGRQFFKELDKHMSSHLEKFATFSVSRGILTSDEEDSSGADGQSGKAQGLGSVDSTPSGILYFESPARSVADVEDDETSIEAPLSDDKDLVLSSEHPDTLTDMAKLVLTYSKQGRWKEAEELLLARVDVKADSKDRDGRTPLSWAAANGQETVVRLLVARADVEADSKDQFDQTPLSRAAANGHEAVVKLLVARADVEADSKDQFNQTPLSRAAAYGHEAVVKLLVARADVEADSKDRDDQTPLSWAAANGQETVVRLLVARADVEADSKDRVDQTPLSRAAANGREAVVKLLVARADVETDSKDRDDRTPLSWAAAYGQEAVVKLLVARADVETDSKDHSGRTPLSRAAANGQEAVVRLLVARADVEADSKDRDGRTPLSRAAANGQEAVVKILQEHNGQPS